MGITSLSNVVSPLIFGPLSALFLADDAPFNFPGFSMLSVGLAYVRSRVLVLQMHVVCIFMMSHREMFSRAACRFHS